LIQNRPDSQIMSINFENKKTHHTPFMKVPLIDFFINRKTYD